MKTLFYGTFIFCSAFLLHMVIWKIHIPRRQRKVLLQIFFGTLVMGIIGLNTAKQLPFLDNIQIALFVISLALAYLVTYSALEADSPSLTMVMSIAKAGKKGLNEGEFKQIISNDLLVKPRIKDLLLDKMVYLDEDTYKLAPKGFLLARIFTFYRKLLRLQKGG